MWNLLSQATSGVLSSFGYEIKDTETALRSDVALWCLRKAVKKGASSKQIYSSWLFTITPSDTQLPSLAKASLLKLRTMKHPSMLTFIDMQESSSQIHVITEFVSPLILHLSDLSVMQTSWGLRGVADGLAFLNNDCKLVHGNLNVWAVFISTGGDWKLGTLDFAQEKNGHGSKPESVRPSLCKYSDPSGTREFALDSWGFGILIWEVFNGELSSIQDLMNMSKIPQNLKVLLKGLCNYSPNRRPTFPQFIEAASKPKGFFDTDFVKTLTDLEQFDVMDSLAKIKFLEQLTPKLDSFPKDVQQHKVLPRLIHAYRFCDVGVAVLTPLLKVGRHLEAEDFANDIVPCLVGLFGKKDRETRLRLLSTMPEFAGLVPGPILVKEVWPHLSVGFGDSVPAIREASLKSCVNLTTMPPKVLKDQVFAQIMRLQRTDPEAGIRTNASVCIGKLVPHLPSDTRSASTLSALLPALRDTFPAARRACITGIVANMDLLTRPDIASKAMPVICPFMLDADVDVRNEAISAIRKLADKIASPVENDEAKAIAAAGAPTKPTTWTEWAFSRKPKTDSTQPSNGASPKVPVDSPRKPDLEQPIKPIPSHALRGRDSSKYDDDDDDDADYGDGGWNDFIDDSELPAFPAKPSFGAAQKTTKSPSSSFDKQSSLKAASVSSGWDDWNDDLDDILPEEPTKPRVKSPPNNPQPPTTAKQKKGAMKLGASKVSHSAFLD